nr:MAG TPA: hypothetical protein [Caudoviricetes sp.]DAU43892.1 MAG TPA: hypothetical protein [Caudoviricetes sp.]
MNFEQVKKEYLKYLDYLADIIKTDDEKLSKEDKWNKYNPLSLTDFEGYFYRIEVTKKEATHCDMK